MDDPTQLSPFAPDFKEHAYAVYAKLRDNEPVSRSVLPDGRTMWLIAGYDDALATLRDHQRFGNNPLNAMAPEDFQAYVAEYAQPLPPEQQARFAEIDDILRRNLLSIDPPDHARLRKLVSQSFTPRFIDGLRPRVQQIADDLLAGIEAQAQTSGRREFELIADFAFPLPITVISEMLGVPGADRERFREWSNAVVQINPAEAANPERFAFLSAFVDYLRAFVADKREHPGDDLTSGLIQAEEEGDKLSEDELLSMIFLLIVAGHETTVNLLGNGLLALFAHPDQFDRLKRDPALLKPAIEEILRWTGPVETSLTRFAREDVELRGHLIRRGEQVTVLLAAADRDAARFPAADRFDVGREPGRHLGFGMGIHACLGAPLARLEGQVAFATLLARLPDLRPAVPLDTLAWRPGSLLRGLVALPVAF